jgi:copper oxidase (laccase) domain-containing protein
MAMGPSIGPCCYEVGPEVAQHFDSARARAARAMLDLREANRTLAIACGLDPNHIQPNPPCTVCHPARFFSHRREGPHTGRMWALMWTAPASSP